MIKITIRKERAQSFSNKKELIQDRKRFWYIRSRKLVKNEDSRRSLDEDNSKKMDMKGLIINSIYTK